MLIKFLGLALLTLTFGLTSKAEDCLECQLTTRPTHASPSPKTVPDIETTFLYDSTDWGKSLELTSIKNLTWEDWFKARDFTLAVFGLGTNLHQSSSFEDSLQFLKNHSGQLSPIQRLTLLSMIASRAAEGYDLDLKGPESIPYSQIWKNIQSQGQHGGICGNIHSFLGEYAKALGFQNVGVTSALWSPTLDGKKAGGHVILHFQDPTTKEYFLQNYGSVVNTHQKTQQGMLDIADRWLNVSSTTLYTSSQTARGEKVHHLYVPSTSRWVMHNLNSAANYKKTERPSVRILLGNQEQIVTANYKRGFLVHSAYNTPEGLVQLDALGYSGAKSGERKNLSYTASTLFGVLDLEAPIVQANGKTSSASRTTLFAGLNLKGLARLGPVTGKLEITAMETDYWPNSGTKSVSMTAPFHDLSAAFTYLTKGAVQLEASRHWEIVPTNLEAQRPHLQTAYDQFHLVIDNQSDKKSIYLVNQSDLYVMRGLEKMSAVAVRERLQVVIPTERRGEFALIGDASRILQNKSKDPFYDSPASAQLTLSWKKAVRRAIEIGGSATASTKNRPYFLFEDSSQVKPVLNELRPGSNAQIWIRTRWK